MAPDGPFVAYRHRGCDGVVDVEYACDGCGQQHLSVHDVVPEAGPGKRAASASGCGAAEQAAFAHHSKERKMVRYSENPTVRVEVHVAAPPGAVWPLVSDISVPARFSTELAGADWIDGSAAPCVGARFTGRNHHDAIGDWQSTCVVVTCEAGQAFSWVVGDPSYPSARWGFELEAEDGGTCLRQWAALGPAPSGLTPAITAMPDKEERIVARRLAEHEANMRRCVEGIKALAEGGPR